MLMRSLCVVLVLAICAGTATAVEAVVVSYEKNKLTVKVGGKEQTYDLPDKVHVHDVDGKEIKPADRAARLKKDVKVDLELKEGKVVEVNILKK